MEFTVKIALHTSPSAPPSAGIAVQVEAIAPRVGVLVGVRVGFNVGVGVGVDVGVTVGVNVGVGVGVLVAMMVGVAVTPVLEQYSSIPLILGFSTWRGNPTDRIGPALLGISSSRIKSLLAPLAARITSSDAIFTCQNKIRTNEYTSISLSANHAQLFTLSWPNLYLVAHMRL